MQPQSSPEEWYGQPLPSIDPNRDSNYLLTELLTSLSDPLTVVMLTVEWLRSGEELSEADHQFLLQNLDRINKAVKWCKQAWENVNPQQR